MTTTAEHTGFEQLYLSLRAKENRIYTDEQLLQLPVISKDHVHYNEWLMRSESASRLFNYLKRKQRPLKILEVGCGNGWLSSCLSSLTGSRIIGTDINFPELQQATRVFSPIPDIQFIHADLFNEIIRNSTYDIILFAASFQYFSSTVGTIDYALRLLKKDGEVHVLDTPFYRESETAEAKERTTRYYTDMGCPEMKEYYHHHIITNLASFPHKILYQPSFIDKHVFRNKNPFTWFRFRNDNQ